MKELDERKQFETQCDTDFRRKFKRVIEKRFEVREYGEQQIQVRSRSDESVILAQKVTGVVYGDGGPYLECNAADVVTPSFVISEEKGYFNLLSTDDGKVQAYVQKREVNNRANPPPNAKYRDIRNRKEGYANYKIGKI